ncbi:MAG: hypothetical protein ACRDZX_08095 [Acidimicrobiales bacterium]
MDELDDELLEVPLDVTVAALPEVVVAALAMALPIPKLSPKAPAAIAARATGLVSARNIYIFPFSLLDF